MEIRNAKDLRAALKSGAHAWPGGYPQYFIMEDCEPMSFESVKAELPRILSELRAKRRNGRHGYDKEWIPVALDVNWEDSNLICAHTNKRIESAYAEEEAAP
jgi:hypothetical protein